MPSPRSTLFPYTTLFRSAEARLLAPDRDQHRGLDAVAPADVAQPRQIGGVALARSEERVSRNAEPEIYTLSLHDALPICRSSSPCPRSRPAPRARRRSAGRCRAAAADWRRSAREIGRAGQQECRARDLHSFPTRRSSDLPKLVSLPQIATSTEGSTP